MKTNSSFKIPKFVKYRMATIVDNNKRHEYRRQMIRAIVEGNQVVAPREKKGKGKPIETETD